jgi:carbonic anhydrase
VDSRVPPELIFDQGLGELFVIRTAGEVLDHAVLGSLEFGVAELQIPLIVVLGHKNCGAVTAAMEYLHHHQKAEDDIEYLVENLALAVEIGDEVEDNRLDRAVRAQIVAVVQQLSRIPMLRAAIKQEKLKVVGAWYDIDTGAVEIIAE